MFEDLRTQLAERRERRTARRVTVMRLWAPLTSVVAATMVGGGIGGVLQRPDMRGTATLLIVGLVLLSAIQWTMYAIWSVERPDGPRGPVADMLAAFDPGERFVTGIDEQKPPAVWRDSDVLDVPLYRVTADTCSGCGETTGGDMAAHVAERHPS